MYSLFDMVLIGSIEGFNCIVRLQGASSIETQPICRLFTNYFVALTPNQSNKERTV